MVRPVKGKKVPLRMCIVCGEKRPKKELIRIIRTPEQKIEIDLSGKRSGRGAYLCLKRECIERAKKEGKLAYALKTEIPSSVYEELEKLLTTGGEIDGKN